MTDTITIELPREVAERWAGDEHLHPNEDTPIVKACREALDNPTRSDEGLRLAEIQVGRAESHDHPLFDLDRAVRAAERVKASVSGTLVADMANIVAILKLAANPETREGGEGE